MFKGTPITPVEATKTSSAFTFNAFPQRTVIFFAFSKPSLPVQVLALPLLIMMACAHLLLKCFLVISSGAPLTLFFV